MVTRYFIQMNFLMFTLFASTSHLYAMYGLPSDRESDDSNPNLSYKTQKLDPEDSDEDDEGFAFCGRLKTSIEDLVREQQRLLSALIPGEFEDDEENEGD